MKKSEQITLVAAYLHSAFQQGRDNAVAADALSTKEAMALWRALRSRRAKSAWLRDAETLLREAGIS